MPNPGLQAREVPQPEGAGSRELLLRLQQLKRPGVPPLGALLAPDGRCEVRLGGSIGS